MLRASWRYVAGSNRKSSHKTYMQRYIRVALQLWTTCDTHMNHIVSLVSSNEAAENQTLVVFEMARFVKRTRFEIINDILLLCLTPTHKTHILYKCNLGYEQLDKYLDLLVSNILLKYFSKDRKYKITEQGRGFIKRYKRLTSFLSKKS